MVLKHVFGPNHTLYHWLRGAVAAALVCCPLIAPAQSLERDDKIRAAYLFNLAKFINWPADSTQVRSPSLNLCVLADDRFRQYLSYLEGRTIHDRPITIVTPEQHNLNSCHLLYIGKGQQAPRHLLHSDDTLTIGNGQEFIRAGGAIALVVQNNLMRLSINYPKIRTSNAKLSANLLETAVLVGRE